MTSDIRPFKIDIEDAKLEDLQNRLANTRFPDELEGAEWDLGVPLADVKRLVSHWKNSFDWRRAEADLNQLPHFETTIEIDSFEPLDIHFVHQKSSVEGAIPLLWVHGWPGSFYEGTKILKPLSEGPTDGSTGPAFHVVAPSLPNFGFSAGTNKRGFSLRHHGMVLNQLMQRLGYTRYATQGGDWGYFITMTMGHQFPDAVLASHLNLVAAGPPTLTGAGPIAFLRGLLTPWSSAEKAGLARSAWFRAEGSGYNNLQATKPQTPGYALSDSPAALLAWVYEKLRDWTDGPYPWTDDEICTWISIYWFSRAGPAASQRLYYEYGHDKEGRLMTSKFGPRVRIGLGLFPNDLILVPRAWRLALGARNIVFERDHEDGGHFPAWERPEEIVRDLRDMFGKGGGAYRVIEAGSKL